MKVQINRMLKKDIKRCEAAQTTNTGSFKLYQELLAKYNDVFLGFGDSIPEFIKSVSYGEEADYRSELNAVKAKLEYRLENEPIDIPKGMEKDIDADKKKCEDYIINSGDFEESEIKGFYRLFTSKYNNIINDFSEGVIGYVEEKDFFSEALSCDDLLNNLSRMLSKVHLINIESNGLKPSDDNKIESEFEMKKFFISHSSEDEKICTAFVNMMEHLGVSEDDILYTSSDRHGVPGDEDIFKYLGSHIKQGITVFYMLSDNYYKSPYCLNEMGAAWIVRNDSSIFTLPNFNGEFKGVIDGNKKAYNLKSNQDLLAIKNKILDLSGGSISEKKWIDIKDEFSNIVQNY